MLKLDSMNNCEQEGNWFQEENMTFKIEDVIFLGEPLSEADTYKSFENNIDDIHLGLQERMNGNQFSPHEREYARMMIRLGFKVYREPEIKDCNNLPDFYIVEPISDFGVLVEITKSSKYSLSERKKRQIKNLEEISRFYNIPFVALFKEDLDMLKE